MINNQTYFKEIANLLSELKKLDFEAILIGGMALVTLGSPRVTKDFDFLISKGAREQKEVINILYKKGFFLASKIDPQGNITSVIDNKTVAFNRLQIDKPASSYFLNKKTGLRIDLLFDFPEPVSKILENAKKIKILSHTLYIASPEDLLRLKKTASKKRTNPNDKQDIEFLKTLS